MVLTRSEDMTTTTPASASRIELKTAATSDGRITAIRAKTYFDNGIYPFGFPGIIGMLMGGYYKCDHVSVEVVQVATHKPQAGAYRAPGAPQVTFALESNIDEMALALNLDPLEFRIQNAVESGDLSGVGRAWPKIGLQACLQKLREHPAWKNRERSSHHGTFEGVGIAIGGWPGGFSPAGAVCRVDTDGTVRLHVGSVDISGVHSSLVLIAAEQLGVQPEAVQIVQGDTDSGPFAPASGGSQVTISVSGAVQDASVQVKNQLLEIAASELEAHKDDLELKNGAAQVKGVPEKAIAIGRLAQLAQSKAGGPGPVVAEGRAAIKSGAPGFTVQLVRVSVDKNTGLVTPLEFVAVQDVGFALNPTLIEGQMHGGNAQGLSMGLYEAMRFDESGNLASANFLEYHFPRASDLPPFEAVIVQEPSDSGPFGARIVGEPPIIAGGAALANAIRDAVGVRVLELPVRPETLWRLMQAK
jgi:CO/xanthine dehydrogenase Mo-binding subunit